MTNDEMQRAMDFIVETNKRSTSKISRAEKRWTKTETRLRALLRRVRARQRSSPAVPIKVRPRQKTEIDRRLEALTRLVEQRISNGCIGN
ncbi:MAG: hypothetical protein ACXWID_02790 [Pyrinomonadaceae bacterium]